jgi:hypothetical protein
MIAHGALVNYWENKVTIPNDPSQVNTPLAFSISSQLFIVIALPSLTLTPLHLLTPNFLEYQLHESITMSSILMNLIDISRTGVNLRGKSHETWKLLLDQYGKLSKRTRNMREWDLDECKYVKGLKVAGKGGHIERMRTLRKLANNAEANFDSVRFKTKLTDSFSELWNMICLICYSIMSLSEVIVILTLHGE